MLAEVGRPKGMMSLEFFKKIIDDIVEMSVKKNQQLKSLLTYKVSSAHSPNHDSGVSWNSFGFEWPVKSPIISERDKTLEELKNFNSPF